MSTFKQKWSALTFGVFGKNPRHLWRRYAVAVLFVALSLIFSNYAPKASLNTVEANAEVINLAGRQRMLSQRILYFAELAVSETTNDEETHGKLRSAVSEFEGAQNRLSDLRKERLAKNPDPQQSELNKILDEHAASFVASAKALDISNAGSQSRVKISDELHVWPDKLLSELNDAVKRDEQYVVGKVQNVHKIANATLGLAFMILILEGLLIFLPGHRMIVNFLDERKKYEAKILEQNEEMQHFTYTASHDLRGPLRAMENLVGWMEEDIDRQDFEETPKHMKLLRSRIRRMNSLLSDMLAFSKIGKGKQEITTFDSGDAIEEVVGWIDAPAGFKIDLDPNLPVLTAPMSGMQQIFLNLLNNAVKHHDKDTGNVKVTYGDGGDEHVFVVSDDGPGIPAEYREYIFKPFSRLATRDQVEGSGIGLAITQKFVNSIQGKISVLDLGTARGTSFQLTVPKNVSLKSLPA